MMKRFMPFFLAALLPCLLPAGTNILDNVPYTTTMWSVGDPFGFSTLSNLQTSVAGVTNVPNDLANHTNDLFIHTTQTAVSNVVRSLQTFQGTLYGTTNASSVIPIAGCLVLDNVPPAGTNTTLYTAAPALNSVPFYFSYDKGRVSTVLAGSVTVKFWARKTSGSASVRPELMVVCTNGDLIASYADALPVALSNTESPYLSGITVPTNVTAAAHCRLVLGFRVTALTGSPGISLQVDDARQLILGVPIASGNYATGLELLNVSNTLAAADAVLSTGKLSMAAWKSGSNSFATAAQGQKADAALPAVSTNGWEVGPHQAWLTSEEDTNALALMEYKLSATGTVFSSETVLPSVNSNFYGGNKPHATCYRGSDWFVGAKTNPASPSSILYRFSNIDSGSYNVTTGSAVGASQFLYDQQRDVVWACGSDGLYKIDPINLSTTRVAVNICFSGMMAMCQDSNYIYTGGYNSYVDKLKINKDTGVVKATNGVYGMAHCAVSIESLGIIVFGSVGGLTFMDTGTFSTYSSPTHGLGILSDDCTYFKDSTGVFAAFACEFRGTLLLAQVASCTNGVYYKLDTPVLSTLDTAGPSYGVFGGGENTDTSADLFGGTPVSKPLYVLCNQYVTEIICCPDGTKIRIDRRLPYGSANEWLVTNNGRKFYTTYVSDTITPIVQVDFNEWMIPGTKEIEDPILPKKQIYGYYTSEQTDDLLLGRAYITGGSFTNPAFHGIATLNGTNLATEGWVRSLLGNGVFYYNTTNESAFKGYSTNTCTYATNNLASTVSRSYGVVSNNQYLGAAITPAQIVNPHGPALVSAYLAKSGNPAHTVSIRPELYFTLNGTDTVYEADEVLPKEVTTGTNLYQWVFHFPDQATSYVLRRFKTSGVVGTPTFTVVMGGAYESTLALSSAGGGSPALPDGIITNGIVNGVVGNVTLSNSTVKVATNLLVKTNPVVAGSYPFSVQSHAEQDIFSIVFYDYGNIGFLLQSHLVLQGIGNEMLWGNFPNATHTFRAGPASTDTLKLSGTGVEVLNGPWRVDTAGNVVAPSLSVISGGSTSSVLTAQDRVYTPIIASSATITVLPTQAMYSVRLESQSVVSNDISLLTSSGGICEWKGAIEFTTTNSLLSTFASNIEWADGTPDLTVTGRYVFAFSTLDSVSVQGRQVYPTVYQKRPYPFVIAADGSYQVFNIMVNHTLCGANVTNATPLLSPIIDQYTLFTFRLGGWGITNRMNWFHLGCTYYGYIEADRSPGNLVKEWNGQGYNVGSYLAWIDVSFMVKDVNYAKGAYQNDMAKWIKLMYSRPEGQGADEVYIMDPKCRKANELEIKAYNAGWRP